MALGVEGVQGGSDGKETNERQSLKMSLGLAHRGSGALARMVLGSELSQYYRNQIAAFEEQLVVKRVEPETMRNWLRIEKMGAGDVESKEGSLK